MHGKLAQGRRRFVCYHEAGHAVVRLWLGHGAENAVVISRAAYLAGATISDRCGGLHRAERIIFGYNISDPKTYKLNLATTVAPEARLLKRYSERIAMDFIMTFAGGVAEGRYRRRSLAGCLIAGGSGDMEHLRRISEAWFVHRAEATAAIVEAERIARAFVRAPKAWAAIGAVAQALLQRG